MRNIKVFKLLFSGIAFLLIFGIASCAKLEPKMKRIVGYDFAYYDPADPVYTYSYIRFNRNGSVVYWDENADHVRTNFHTSDYKYYKNLNTIYIGYWCLTIEDDYTLKTEDGKCYIRQ